MISILLTLLLTLLGSPGWASDSSSSVEELFLRKKRVRAIERLFEKRTRQYGPMTEEDSQEFYEVLNHLLESHYTNKAVQIYEQMVALKQESVTQALARIDSVEKLEPKNFKIKRLKALLLLSKEDCRSAGESIKVINEKFSRFIDVKWLSDLLLACRKAQVKLEFTDLTSDTELIIRAAHAARLQDKKRLRPLLEQLEQRFAGYSEIEFYKMILTEDNLEREKLRTIYKAKCQSPNQNKLLSKNPWRCKNVDTVLPANPSTISE